MKLSIFSNDFKQAIAPFIHFTAFFLGSTLLYVLALGGLMDVLPSRLAWIVDFVFPICVVAGFATSLFALYTAKKTSKPIPSIEAVIQSGTISAVGIFMLITLYSASFVISPPKYLTFEDFQSAELSDSQVQQIIKVVDAKGYLTLVDLQSMGLTSDQQQIIKNMLEELGYPDREAVEEIARNTSRTQIALVATQTSVAKLTSCYITPEDNYPNVTIRKTPEDKAGNKVMYLSEGQQLHVVGHNGGRINQDRWWLVELENSLDGEQYGWVASWVTKEINESECYKVTKSPGSD